MRHEFSELGDAGLGGRSVCHTAMLSVGCVATFGAMNDWELWLLRAVWLLLPFTAGPAFAEALSDTERSFRIGTSVALWVVWAAMMIALMVPRTETLTAMRLVVPASLIAFVWAAVDAGGSLSTTEATIGAVSVAIVFALSLRASVSDVFVDGSSYGDESRFLLRTPGPLLLGPIFVVWALAVGGVVTGPMLLIGQNWVLGGVATVIGAPLAVWSITALHRLSRRWLVFVPAGLVVHDKTALREPQLFSKNDIARFGAAPADTTLEDLSLDALGLALRVELTGASKVMRNGRDPTIGLTDIDGFIVMPNRPGAVLSEAAERGLTIG